MTAHSNLRESMARSRVLLRRIREALAQPESDTNRLEMIVRIIATNMVAEVCSIYLRAHDDFLELCATQGLNRASVHVARLSLGEGLVGRIAKTGAPINTDDPQNTPGFQYLPMTGEEEYRSFLGVPIQRQGHILGVLVVQNVQPRRYDEDEVDALELIATVIAEMADAGALVDPVIESESKERGPLMLTGQGAAEGVAMGRISLHEPKLVVTKPIADDIAVERERLLDAMAGVRGEVDRLVSDDHLGDAGEHRDVLEAFRMVAHDGGWLRRLEAAVDQGLAAEAAVEKVQSETRARLGRISDPYLRDRLSDLDDLAHRLLRRLQGVAPPAPEDLPENAVLIARSLGPGELLDYGRASLKAVALEEGSAGGHAAVVARALGVPLVTGVTGLLHDAEADDEIVVDGDIGRVLLRPDIEISNAYREKLHLRDQEKAQFRALRDKPAVTKDDVRVSLQMNAGLLSDLPNLRDSGAEGVGLYRTELQYLISTRAPRRDAQTQLYRQVLDAAEDVAVTFRTLDMGGDKQLPFLRGQPEENPALGWRAIRIALDRPLLFRMQLQALVRAGAGRALSVMFPMVATAEEFQRAKALLELELERARNEGRPEPAALKIGVMLETPALAYASDAFFQEADFISLGGNDLAQFFFAADRGNARVNGRYDPLHPAYLRCLRDIVRRCSDAQTPLSFCGESCGRPLDALALAAIGFRTFSMRPASIGPVKRSLRSVELAAASEVVLSALEQDASGAVRTALKNFCAQTGVPA